MIGVAIAALIILGLTANYLIKTTKVVNIILIAQRNYMMDYHRSLEDFYSYLSDTSINRSSLDSANLKISAAKVKLQLFSNVKKLFIENTKEGIVKSVCAVYKVEAQDAALLVNRVNLFNKLNI